jgi:hypothetical protein
MMDSVDIVRASMELYLVSRIESRGCQLNLGMQLRLLRHSSFLRVQSRRIVLSCVASFQISSL